MPSSGWCQVPSVPTHLRRVLFWGASAPARKYFNPSHLFPPTSCPPLPLASSHLLRRLRHSDHIHALPDRRTRCTMDDEGTQPSTSPDPSTTSATGTHADAPPKKKQKRNKPTLSCEECVERKTKVSASLWRNASPRLTRRSVTELVPIAWPASSDNQHANTPKSPTCSHPPQTRKFPWHPWTRIC
jgi:hypothetical protein